MANIKSMKKGLCSCGHVHVPPAHDLSSSAEPAARPTSTSSRSPYGSGARRRPGVCRCAAGGSLLPEASSRSFLTAAFDWRTPVEALVEMTRSRFPEPKAWSSGEGGAIVSSSWCGAEEFFMGR